MSNKDMFKFLSKASKANIFNINIKQLKIHLSDGRLLAVFHQDCTHLHKNIMQYVEVLHAQYIKLPNDKNFILTLYSYIFYSLVLKLAYKLEDCYVNVQHNIYMFGDEYIIDDKKVIGTIEEIFQKFLTVKLDLSSVNVLEENILRLLDSRDLNFINITKKDFLDFIYLLKEKCSENILFSSELLFCEFQDNTDYLESILSFIDKWNNEYKYSDHIIKCDFGDYSAGEEYLLKTLAQLNAQISTTQIWNKKIILLFDEYEIHLHPEWSRQFLYYLTKFLQSYKNLTFQVILTTHSPYLISDLPKENIILLEKDEKTGKRTAKKSNYGFASNYYDIMSDSFFLDDTIGEFAKQKINECIRKMNTITYLLKKIKDKNLVISKLLNKKIPIRMKGIEQIISIVGDPYIKKPLEGMLSALIDQLNSLKLKQKSLEQILRERQIALQSNGAKND